MRTYDAASDRVVEGAEVRNAVYCPDCGLQMMVSPSQKGMLPDEVLHECGQCKKAYRIPRQWVRAVPVNFE